MGKNMKITGIFVEFSLLNDIYSATDKATELAYQLNGDVVFDFNGVLLRASPKRTAQMLREKYWNTRG
jgi:hypothetical protein